MKIGAIFSQADSGVDPVAIRRVLVLAQPIGVNRIANPGLGLDFHLDALLNVRPELEGIVGPADSGQRNGRTGSVPSQPIDAW